jgi:hypothetical protein
VITLAELVKQKRLLHTYKELVTRSTGDSMMTVERLRELGTTADGVCLLKPEDEAIASYTFGLDRVADADLIELMVPIMDEVNRRNG